MFPDPWRRGMNVYSGSDVPVQVLDLEAADQIARLAPGGKTGHRQHLVNAAGGWAAEPAGVAGLDVPVVHSRRRPNQTDGDDIIVDWQWMESDRSVGAERFLWVSDLPLDRSACWAGTYENTPDHQAILGADPTTAIPINACGLSGRGLVF